MARVTAHHEGAGRGTGTIELELDTYRRELTGYCYRMLGSGFEAEDAVQETMIRAWRNIDRFEGRASLRSWLYRIATNVCLDMLQGPQRRARPMDLGPSSTADTKLGPDLPETTWIQPIPDASVVPIDGDPADVAAARDTIRLAFVAALQHLPPRQRAVLILREVLRWHATEVGELLEMTVASVNSALQRARATLASLDIESAKAPAMSDQDEELVARYMDAFERYDINSLVSLLHEDATFSMPPHELWLVGPEEVAKWHLGQGRKCRGSRVVPTRANGCIGYGAYHPTENGPFLPFALVVVETSNGGISGVHNFLFPELFAAFGLPASLDP
jgi:RNA polymerase sigma-70 factor, ECF subfamily